MLPPNLTSPPVETWPPAQQPEDIDAEERRAFELRGQLRAREAMNIFEHLVGTAPKRASVHSGLGFCWLDLRDYAKALPHFENALDLDPTNGYALYGAAIALLELGRLEEAASYGRRQAGLADAENRARGHYVLGLIDHARGAWREAAANLEESLRIQPKHRRRRHGRPGAGEVRHRYILAQCYRELNEPRRALQHLEWIEKARPSRSLQLELAELYLEMGRTEEAERCFQALLEQRPDERQARLGMGRVYLARHDDQQAIQAFSRVLAMASDDLEALNGMAEAYKGLGDLDRALGYLNQIQQLYRLPQGQLERRLRALELERERRDAELLRMRNIAALNLMATGIAHELRQPLTVIRLAAQNAHQDLVHQDFRQLDSDLADIDANVTRIDKVIATLREISSQDGALDEEIDLAAVFDGALALFRTQLAHREIELSVRDLDRYPVMGHRPALQQVFINLISNARDALAEAPEKRIEVWAVPGPSDVCVYFHDTGCGMPAAVRDQAFDPFFTTKKDGGTGLGLYISFNLVRRMGGRLRIQDSSPGRGTTFEIRLRRAPGAMHE